MWSEGIIGIPASVDGKPIAVLYWVKHYKNPSKFGMLKIENQIVCNYDRGWDVYPTCKAAEAALEILLYEYDGRSNND